MGREIRYICYCVNVNVNVISAFLFCILDAYTLLLLLISFHLIYNILNFKYIKLYTTYFAY